MTGTNKFPNPPIVRTISLDGENILFDSSLKEQYTMGDPLNFVPVAAVRAMTERQPQQKQSTTQNKQPSINNSIFVQ
jgi:hypothetical protein